MSAFSVTVKRILAIEPHPNADAIELARVGGYVAVVRKSEFRSGDLAVYIPEDAIVPPEILARLGLEGKLAGPQKNRVKAIRLRGVLSQGLVGSLAALGIEAGEGDEVAERLGITKYEPPIPVAMAGEVFNAGRHLTLDFDVENWKAHPDILQEGEEVIVTEKLHGTCTIVAILPYRDAHPEAFGEHHNILVCSKGLGAKGLAFKNNERNANNLYVRATSALVARIDKELHDNPDGPVVPFFILGETIGRGVQDLHYGASLDFRVFAMAEGYRGHQTFMNWSSVTGSFKAVWDIETVPVLYRGPFSEAVMREYTDGLTTLGADHIREGIVMTPVQERTHPAIGRVCLKSVSGDYLTRKGGTEYN
jgi:RNA ligase (TIGR02306 family)